MLAITDNQFDSPGDDHENLNEEQVTIGNIGNTDVSMTGWWIEDDVGHTYAFPDGFTLPAGTAVTVRTGSGEDTEQELYWGSEHAIWDNTGDSVFLYDNNGTLVLKESY
jgi:competence protein ComEC